MPRVPAHKKPRDGGRYVGHSLLRSLVPASITIDELSEKIELYERSHHRERFRSTVEGWVKGTRKPSARSAWILGEALRLDSMSLPRVPFASGLLALSWFGYPGDFVGVIGSCNKTSLAPFGMLLLPLVKLAHDTAYISPYTVARSELPIFDEQETTANDLRRLTRAGHLRKLPPGTSLKAIAKSISDRRLARKAWVIPDRFVRVARAGAMRWFGNLSLREPPPAKKEKPKGPPPPRVPFDQLPQKMQYAYAVAESRLDEAFRREFLADAIIQWFYEEAQPREPDPDAVREWATLVTNPSSHTARAARMKLESYIMLVSQQQNRRMRQTQFDFDAMLRDIAGLLVERYSLPAAEYEKLMEQREIFASHNSQPEDPF